MSVGALELSTTIDPGIALSRVTVKLRGAVMGQLNISYDNPFADIDVSANGCTAKGRVSLNLVRPPSFSTLDGAITLLATDSARAWCLSSANAPHASNDNTQNFKGTLFSWVGATHLVLQRQQQWVLPELMVQTDIIDTDAEITMYPQGAVVTLFYGPQILWSQTVLMGVQLISVRDISAGSVTLDAGASFSLVPATPIQPGRVVGKFMARNQAFSGKEAYAKFDGVLAQWVWPGRQPGPYQEAFK